MISDEMEKESRELQLGNTRRLRLGVLKLGASAPDGDYPPDTQATPFFIQSTTLVALHPPSRVTPQLSN